MLDGRTDVDGAPIPDGWERDADDWLWRRQQPADKGQAFFVHEMTDMGFVEIGRVFVRNAAVATAFDGAKNA